MFRRMLPRARGVWCRLLAVLWCALMLALGMHLLAQRRCQKRLFPYQQQLEQSTAAVSEVLDRLQLHHFLCYGSLWGQLHEQRNPPWEADAELCLVKTDPDDDTVDEKMVAELKVAGFTADLDARRGRYDVFPSDGTPGLVQLILFAPHLDDKTYRRDGWVHRSLSDDCQLEEELHCFPARLVAPPLERKPWGAHRLPVPWHGFQLQKHHYRDSWFRDYEPTC